jgi:hypothetical protein
VRGRARLRLARSHRTACSWLASPPRKTALLTGSPHSCLLASKSLAVHVDLVSNRKTYRPIAATVAPSELRQVVRPGVSVRVETRRGSSEHERAAIRSEVLDDDFVGDAVHAIQPRPISVCGIALVLLDDLALHRHPPSTNHSLTSRTCPSQLSASSSPISSRCGTFQRPARSCWRRTRA